MKTPYVAVFGSINLDICGKADAPLIPEDSNPGRVSLSMGGVGRNIAHNLSLLGTPVTLLTALAGDGYERQIRDDCKQCGIDLSAALRLQGGRTATYLVIEGPEGDVALALCDASACQALTPDYLAGHLPLLCGASAVVIDANPPAESLAWLLERCTAPVFADPVSVTKAEKLRPVLGRIHTLKPNLLEAEALSGVQITDYNTLELAAAKLLQTGLRRVCISLGSRGVYCAWDDKRHFEPCPQTRLVNASGGGDAMMAGFVRAFLDDLPIDRAAKLALACSSIAVSCEQTINPALSLQAARALAFGQGAQENQITVS